MAPTTGNPHVTKHTHTHTQHHRTHFFSSHLEGVNRRLGSGAAVRGMTSTSFVNQWFSSGKGSTSKCGNLPARLAGSAGLGAERAGARAPCRVQRAWPGHAASPTQPAHPRTHADAIDHCHLVPGQHNLLIVVVIIHRPQELHAMRGWGEWGCHSPGPTSSSRQALPQALPSGALGSPLCPLAPLTLSTLRRSPWHSSRHLPWQSRSAPAKGPACPSAPSS